MGRIETQALSLTFIIVLSCLTLVVAKPTNAQTIPKPAVPEFTVKYADNSYYAPTPTAITDQYGNSRVVQGYVENKTFEFSIKNQAFAPYTIPYNSSDPYNTGQTVSVMYNIRMKQSEGNWAFITHLSDGYLSQSAGHSTIASYPLDQLFPSGIPYGSEIEFQVQALIGYVHRYPIINSWTFNGTESDWSSTQIVTIPVSSASPTPSPTVHTSSSPMPTINTSAHQPETHPSPTSIVLATVLIATAVVITAILLYSRHQKTVNLKKGHLPAMSCTIPSL